MQQEFRAAHNKFPEKHKNITALAQLIIGIIILAFLLFAVNTIYNIRMSAAYNDTYTGGVLTPEQIKELAMRNMEKEMILTYGTWGSRMWYAVTHFGDSSLESYQLHLWRNKANLPQNPPPLPEVVPFQTHGRPITGNQLP